MGSFCTRTVLEPLELSDQEGEVAEVFDQMSMTISTCGYAAIVLQPAGRILAMMPMPKRGDDRAELRVRLRDAGSLWISPIAYLATA